MSKPTSGNRTILLEITYDLEGISGGSVIEIPASDDQTIRQVVEQAIERSNLPRTMKDRLISVISSDPSSSREVSVLANVLTTDGRRIAIDLNNTRVGDLIRNYGTNRVELSIQPVVGY